MRIIKCSVLKMLLALCVSALVGSAIARTAQPFDPVDVEQGKQYRLLSKPQSTESGKKIEVIQFFAYYCPHCYYLEPLLDNWVKKQGDKISFKRIHVSRPYVDAQLRLFLTLNAMGIANKYQGKVFDAYHVEHNRLKTPENIATFVTKAGIDMNTFMSTNNSPSVNIEFDRTKSLMQAYEIDSWPTVIIDGRIQTSPEMAAVGRGNITGVEQNEGFIPVLDALISKVQKEKAGNK